MSWLGRRLDRLESQTNKTVILVIEPGQTFEQVKAQRNIPDGASVVLVDTGVRRGDGTPEA